MAFSSRELSLRVNLLHYTSAKLPYPPAFPLYIPAKSYGTRIQKKYGKENGSSRNGGNVYFKKEKKIDLTTRLCQLSKC